MPLGVFLNDNIVAATRYTDDLNYTLMLVTPINTDYVTFEFGQLVDYVYALVEIPIYHTLGSTPRTIDITIVEHAARGHCLNVGYVFV